MFSVSTIYSTKDFLNLVGNHTIAAKDYNEAFGKFRFDSAVKVLQLATECGWVNLLPDGMLVVSAKGEAISVKGYKDGLRMQLEDMILYYNPTWGSLLPKGREETLRYLPETVRQCFKEAGFDEEFSDDLIEFWDRLALAYRNYNQQQLLETGRSGERLSIEFEKERTKRKPIWQAIESNLSGYDILSYTSETTTERLLIEVKTTTSKLDYANFFISRNEWLTAENSTNYTFHLWHLDSNPKLFIVEPSVIRNHIATNNGQGEWESIKIPFVAVIEHSKPNYTVN